MAEARPRWWQRLFRRPDVTASAPAAAKSPAPGPVAADRPAPDLVAADSPAPDRSASASPAPDPPASPPGASGDASASPLGGPAGDGPVSVPPLAGPPPEDRPPSTPPVNARGAGPVSLEGMHTPTLGEDPSASAARLGVGVGVELEPAAVLADDEHRYINRELSTLDFNSRVLALAERQGDPLLERAKFAAIFSSNMDEFFQVRVAGLKDQLAAGIGGTAPDGLSVSDQLRAIRGESMALFERRRRVLLEDLMPALSEASIVLTDFDALDGRDRAWARRVFTERIFPVLTPLAVDPGHPFPYISNLSLNLAVIVRDPVRGDRRFARLKVPEMLPGLVGLPDGQRFVPLEQVIAAHLGALFPGMEIESHHVFRVTRNADLTLEDEEADDLLEAVEMELRRRRFGRAVRLEVDAHITDEVRELLTRELDLTAEDVYDIHGPLNVAGLWVLHGLDRPELKDEPFAPITPPELAGVDDEPADVFAVIRSGDILVQHPYDSFASSVETFIAEAAHDPDVLAIKQTLYRTSGDSPIVQSLIRAAERGKQVAALVELKARGDEAANIGWAKALERAGVHVVYGLVGLKTHSKTALVVRREGDGIRRYCHIGTGNYNSTTARLYEDLGVLTANPDLGADLTDLFNFLTGYSRRVDYRRLLVAPANLRTSILELIARERELGPAGRIVWKLNNLVDTHIIDALYEASAAGVQIDLITRAICCLRPGVAGLSDNIRVRSLVGRWLEHSRVYYFGGGAVAPGAANGQAGANGHRPGADGHPNGDSPVRTDHGWRTPRVLPDDGEWYLGSADMMERNLDRRVEAVVQIDPPDLQSRLREIIEVELLDDVLSWTLGPDGTWSKVPVTVGFNAQDHFAHLATERARRRRDPDSVPVPDRHS